MLLSSNTATANCVTYDSAVITGRLQRLVFPGRYNYESIASGDEAETGFYLFPQTPLCLSRVTNQNHLSRMYQWYNLFLKSKMRVVPHMPRWNHL